VQELAKAKAEGRLFLSREEAEKAT